MHKVVENSSSALDYALEQKDFIHANHMKMCRFSGFDDSGYEKVKAGVSRCLEEILNTTLQAGRICILTLST